MWGENINVGDSSFGILFTFWRKFKNLGETNSSSTFGGKEGHWEGYVHFLVLWDTKCTKVTNASYS